MQAMFPELGWRTGDSRGHGSHFRPFRRRVNSDEQIAQFGRQLDAIGVRSRKQATTLNLRRPVTVLDGSDPSESASGGHRS